MSTISIIAVSILVGILIGAIIVVLLIANEFKGVLRLWK